MVETVTQWINNSSLAHVTQKLYIYAIEKLPYQEADGKTKRRCVQQSKPFIFVVKRRLQQTIKTLTQTGLSAHTQEASETNQIEKNQLKQITKLKT